MDVNKIFDLFNENNPPNGEDTIISKTYKHPLFWVGMFEKTIKNKDVFKNKILKSFPPEFDIEELNKSGDDFIFDKAYTFISMIDLTDPEHQKAILARSKYGLQSAISSTMDYFIIWEEYEKCAFLKKIQTFLEEGLAI